MDSAIAFDQLAARNAPCELASTEAEGERTSSYAHLRGVTDRFEYKQRGIDRSYRNLCPREGTMLEVPRAGAVRCVYVSANGNSLILAAV